MSIFLACFACSYADEKISSSDNTRFFISFSSGSLISHGSPSLLSFEALSDLCVQVNDDLANGVFGSSRINLSCKLSSFSVGGEAYWGISLANANLTNFWYCNGSLGVFYSRANTDSLLSLIFNYVSSIPSKLSTVSDCLSTLISNVTTIHSDLESIDLLLSACAQSLSNLNNYFNGDFRYYFLDIKNDVASSDTFLGQISTKMDSMVNTLTTENGKNSLFYPITQRLSTIISRIVPAYSHPFANRGWCLSGNDLSSLSVSDVGYSALSSMMETVTEEYLSYNFFAGSYYIDLLDSLDIVHATVGGNTGYFIRGTGTLSKSVNGINEFYEDQTFYLGESNNTLFYASDTSSGSLDTSGLENALSNINDNITRLFGEYDSTYEFPLIPTSFSSNVTVSGAKSSLFASVSDSPDLYYCLNPRLSFVSFSRVPSGDSPLGSSYICKPDGLNAFTYFEDLSSNPVPSGTVLYRTFKLRYYDAFVLSFSDVPFTVSVSGDSCYIDGTIAPKWDSSGSWLGWYLNDTIIKSDSEPDFHILSSPPASGDYYIYSTSSSPVPVVYSTRFTGFLQSQVVLLQNAIGSIGASDLTGVTTRLDSIIDELQSSSGKFSCDHTYSQEMTQAPTCILPGLQVSTCSKCGSSYSEIVSALGHDWQCIDHVEDVTDPDTGEVTETGYDVYECSLCGDTYNDYSGSGAPDDYGDTSISKIIVRLFSKLGTFAGKIISWIIDLFDKTLGGLDDLITRFSELSAQITGFGGDYPTWLSGFLGVLPQELQLALGFSFVCLFVGLIGRKLFFA